MLGLANFPVWVTQKWPRFIFLFSLDFIQSLSPNLLTWVHSWANQSFWIESVPPPGVYMDIFIISDIAKDFWSANFNFYSASTDWEPTWVLDTGYLLSGDHGSSGETEEQTDGYTPVVTAGQVWDVCSLLGLEEWKHLPLLTPAREPSWKRWLLNGGLKGQHWLVLNNSTSVIFQRKSWNAHGETSTRYSL